MDVNEVLDDELESIIDEATTECARRNLAAITSALDANVGWHVRDLAEGQRTAADVHQLEHGHRLHHGCCARGGSPGGSAGGSATT